MRRPAARRTRPCTWCRTRSSPHAGELAPMRNAEGVRVAVEIEPRDRGEADARVELGPRRAGEDLDRVPQGDELPGQMAGVDPLAATARIAAIGQVGDAQAPGRGGAAGSGAGTSIWSDRSHDSFVSIHFWRGVLGNGCPDSARHEATASPNALVRRKRRGGRRCRGQMPGQPTPNQLKIVSTT